MANRATLTDEFERHKGAAFGAKPFSPSASDALALRRRVRPELLAMGDEDHFL